MSQDPSIKQSSYPKPSPSENQETWDPWKELGLDESDWNTSFEEDPWNLGDWEEGGKPEKKPVASQAEIDRLHHKADKAIKEYQEAKSAYDDLSKKEKPSEEALNKALQELKEVERALGKVEDAKEKIGEGAGELLAGKAVPQSTELEQIRADLEVTEEKVQSQKKIAEAKDRIEQHQAAKNQDKQGLAEAAFELTGYFNGAKGEQVFTGSSKEGRKRTKIKNVNEDANVAAAHTMLAISEALSGKGTWGDVESKISAMAALDNQKDDAAALLAYVLQKNPKVLQAIPAATLEALHTTIMTGDNPKTAGIHTFKGPHPTSNVKKAAGTGAGVGAAIGVWGLGIGAVIGAGIGAAAGALTAAKRNRQAHIKDGGKMLNSKLEKSQVTYSSLAQQIKKQASQNKALEEKEQADDEAFRQEIQAFLGEDFLQVQRDFEEPHKAEPSTEPKLLEEELY